jgi:5,6-dimethylbenzimidazole synthase
MPSAKRHDPAGSPPAFDDEFRGRFIELLKWRRDVRSFRSDPVADETLNELLSLANLAPSVGLSQPWRFVIVGDAQRRAAVRANFLTCNADALAHQAASAAGAYARLKLAGLDEAPRHIAVFADDDPAQGRGLGRRTMPETTSYSAVMAIHTLWLAARVVGLGVGWLSILDPAVVTEALDVPSSWTFVGYFCLGYPAAESETPELECLGWERRSRVEAPPLIR